jgi:DNA invertase Pin-like site-specific DNA recombinase
LVVDDSSDGDTGGGTIPAARNVISTGGTGPRTKGRLLGRPKGALGKSKLDGKEEEIRMLLEKTGSKASIAKIVGVSRTTLHHFIRNRKLVPKAS